MIDRAKLEELRHKWGVYPGYEVGGFKEALDTIDKLLSVKESAELDHKTCGGYKCEVCETLAACREEK